MPTHKYIILGILLIFYSKKLEGGKTATKVGLAGIATVGGGGTGGYQVADSNTQFSSSTTQGNGTIIFKNDMERLKYDLFVIGQYDKALRPVKDPKKITSVTLDFTLRQILDLDEKNQVLKTYIWNRQRWTDEFLTWNKTKYGDIDNLWIPANTVWRPDVVMYEDTGSRDYNPRLPYYRVSSEGTINAAEPIVIETSCSIDIAFFPFDFQRCSTTFTSWTFPSSKVDVLASKGPDAIMEDIHQYFLQTGEWTIQDVIIVKTSESFASLVEGSGTSILNDDGFQDTSHIRKLTMEPILKVEDLYPDRLTDVHWSDIRYTFILRRNSSLYMQSMLFPAILLTTVALLGFYLPPDSGERIGLQITILLTFMVFLLTVGEMFPASTGPFLGVYYVMCMALLGVNLFMTVLVLHLHYMPSAAVMGVNEEGGMQIKPVPKWVRILLKIAKFKFRKNSSKGRETPTSHIVLNIVKTGHLGAKMNESREDIKSVPKNGDAIFVNESADNNKNDSIKKEDPYIICTNKRSINHGKSKITPVEHDMYEENKNTTVDASDMSDLESASSSSYGSEGNSETCSNYSSDSIRRRQTNDRHHDNNHYSNEHENDSIYSSLIRNMNQITRFLKAQNKHLRESNVSDDIENEWKAMARTIDHLCMKLYLAILILSHIIILGAALVQSANYSHDSH